MLTIDYNHETWLSRTLVGLTMILNVPLSAWFCLGRWEFGRTCCIDFHIQKMLIVLCPWRRGQRPRCRVRKHSGADRNRDSSLASIPRRSAARSPAPPSGRASSSGHSWVAVAKMSDPLRLLLQLRLRCRPTIHKDQDNIRYLWICHLISF